MLTIPAALALIVSGTRSWRCCSSAARSRCESALLASQSLAAYALGLPFFVLVKVLAPAFFARGDTATPVRIGMITLVLNFALNLALFIPLQHVGPALATSLAAIFNVGRWPSCCAGAASWWPTRACAGGCRGSGWRRWRWRPRCG